MDEKHAMEMKNSDSMRWDERQRQRSLRFLEENLLEYGLMHVDVAVVGSKQNRIRDEMSVIFEAGLDRWTLEIPAIFDSKKIQFRLRILESKWYDSVITFPLFCSCEFRASWIRNHRECLSVQPKTKSFSIFLPNYSSKVEFYRNWWKYKIVCLVETYIVIPSDVSISFVSFPILLHSPNSFSFYENHSNFISFIWKSNRNFVCVVSVRNAMDSGAGYLMSPHGLCGTQSTKNVDHCNDGNNFTLFGNGSRANCREMKKKKNRKLFSIGESWFLHLLSSPLVSH